MILDDLAALLQQSGAGTLGTDLFLGYSPDTPDTLTAVVEYAGGPAEYVNERSLPNVEVVRIQVVCRSADYVAARSRADSAYRALASVTNTEIAGVPYLSMRPLQSPYLVSRDLNQRVVIAFSLEVRKGFV